jgi:glutamate/tyrosine decarboxylase-like PLP-dependent enzyme
MCQAAIILGMEFRALPTYRKDDYALRADVVREALTEDSKKGLIPFMLSMRHLFKMAGVNNSYIFDCPDSCNSRVNEYRYH